MTPVVSRFLTGSGNKPGRCDANPDHEEGIGRVFPGVDRPQTAHRQTEDGHAQPRPRVTPPAQPAETQQQAEPQGEGQQRERHGHHVGVQIREQKGEEREFGDVETVSPSCARRSRASAGDGWNSSSTGIARCCAKKSKLARVDRHTLGAGAAQFHQLHDPIEIAGDGGHQRAPTPAANAPLRSRSHRPAGWSAAGDDGEPSPGFRVDATRCTRASRRRWR